MSKAWDKFREYNEEYTQSFLSHRKSNFEALVREMKYGNSGRVVSDLALFPSLVGYLIKVKELNILLHQVQKPSADFNPNSKL